MVASIAKMGQKLARPSQLISVSTGHPNVPNVCLACGSPFHPNIAWCFPYANLNDCFSSWFILFCFFGQNGLRKLKSIFKGRNKQIVPCSCVAYCLPRMTNSCKEGAKIYLIPLRIRIRIHKPRLCLRAPDVLERIVIWRIKI